MMAITHLLATLLLAYLISRVHRWEARDTVLALAYGVLVDLDHLWRAPAFVQTHDLASVTLEQALAWGPLWQGSMHTVWGAAVVLAAVVAVRSFVPAVFWGLHMVMDFKIATEYVVWGSTTEWALVAVLFTVLLTLALRVWRRGQPMMHPLRYWAIQAESHLLPAVPALSMLLPFRSSE